METIIKGEFGFMQGKCPLCGDEDSPLIKYKKEYICSSCLNTIKRRENSVKFQKKIDEEREFLNRVMNF